MSRPARLPFLLTGLAAAGLLAGCFSSAPAPTGSKETAGGKDAGLPDLTERNRAPAGSGDEQFWEEYPDVPYVPIMQDVDGLEIPRLEAAAQDLQIKGELPVDVGNEHAKKKPAGESVTGDSLIVRFGAEPKSLNPVVETSAVQTYIGQYVHEGLVRMDPETMEYEPHVAERWVAEDSVKLASDYPGQERQIALGNGKPSGKLEVEYEAGPDDEPNVLTFTTLDGAARPLANVWVGLYPVGRIPGAPANGYHNWSNDEGTLKISGIVPGKYTVRVGAELFGKTTRHDDGSLTIRPETPGNPLSEVLQSSGEESLTLKKGEWADVQQETIYTYFLRDDVKWSDGTPFTTRDIEFAYAVINNEYVDGESLRIYYQDLISCQGIDDHTVRMQYRQQYFLSFNFTAGLSAYGPPWHQFASFFEGDGKSLTLERLTPDEERAQNKVSAHGQQFGRFYNTDTRYNNSPLGTGPYTVDRWVRADRVELRRNPNYWNPERGGHLDRLVFKFIPDNVTALRALQAGEIDFLWGLDAEQFFEDLAGPPAWFKDRGYVKASWYSPSFSYVGWNLLNPLFQDRRVRTALTLLTDRQEFLERKLHGEAVLVSGGQYIFGTGYDHEVSPLGYDIEVARELLADAGWVDTDNDGVLDKDGKDFRFTLLLPPGNPVAQEQVALMQRAFRRAGIMMDIRNFEWASFIDKVRSRDFDAVRLGWATSIESDPFQIWHGSQAGADKRGSNHGSFSNALTDELIEMLRVTLDEEKRKRIHWSLHRILDREQPYMFLYTSKDFGAYHQRFRGVKWYRLRPGFDFTEWYVPKDEQMR